MNISEMNDTASGQMNGLVSTTNGQTDTRSRQSDRQTSTTSGKTSTTIGQTSTTSKQNSTTPWCSGVVVITTTQRHLTKSKLRFYAGSNPACGVSMASISENGPSWK